MYLIVACSLWVCGSEPLEITKDEVKPCIALAAAYDHVLAESLLKQGIDKGDTKVVCMSKEQYAIAPKIDFNY